MTPTKRILPIAFAVIFGGVGLFLTQTYVGKQKAELEAERQKMMADYQDPVNIVVARREIQQGEIIAGDALGMRPVPQKFIPPTATARPEDVISQQARVHFSPGEPILRDKIGSPESKDDQKGPEKLSVITPPGKRAVTLSSEEVSAVGNFIKPGDKVDVLWTFRVGSEVKGEVVTMQLFQGVQVLAVDDAMIGSPDQPEEPADRRRMPIPGRAPATTVTVALTPQEISMLLHARQQGRIQLSLRSSMEGGESVAVQPADREAIMKSVFGHDPFAEMLPREVKVCKGLDCSNVTVGE